MEKDNSKVPVAILSCFLIAFVLQGILKISGVFVFEKALDWEIFKLIDNNMVLNVIYYSCHIFFISYCLSFALTTKCYSRKWIHYFILIVSSICITTIRTFVNISFALNIFLDIFMYIVVPLFINITTEEKDRLFKINIFNIILTITIQISLYYCYLGLSYWSSMISSILPLSTLWLSSSANLLIKMEVYIGLTSFLIGMNMLIKKTKEVISMHMPIDIASEEAKIAELEEKKVEKK